jgi:hypothetical protein
MKWDKSVKKITTLHKTESFSIVKTHLNSPFFLISERDAIEKKIQFYFNRIFYDFSSSIEDEKFKSEKNVIRCTNFINISLIAEDEEFFHFISLNQTDIKVYCS